MDIPVRQRVLIIDDEKEIGNLLAQTCDRAGYDATATDRPDVFRQVALTQPEFIIMDLHMPEADGIELFRFLMENNVKSGILLVSGSDHRIVQSAARLAQAQGLRMLGTLAKPFDIADIPLLLSARQSNAEGAFPPQTGPIAAGDIEQALANHQIHAYYQPQIDLKTNSVVGFETLARWIHPERGMVAPVDFIPVAESSGMIHPLTNYMVQATLGQMDRLKKAGLRLRGSINVSALSLSDVNFPDSMLQAITAAGANPSDISFEVTEGKVFEDSIKSLDVLTRLRVKGLTVSIDDFGTGYSTFQQLQQAPFNELKIDKSFVLNCDSDPESRTIVRTTIELARRIGIGCVAEGVETQAVAQLLRDWGCKLAQGYYYSRPLPADLFMDWVSAKAHRES